MNKPIELVYLLLCTLVRQCASFSPLQSPKHLYCSRRDERRELGVKNDDSAEELADETRRRLLLSPLVASFATFDHVQPSCAADSMGVLPAESSELPAGLLNARVTENVLSPPPYGMEGPDIYYPSWFTGTWRVDSECTDVMAPCGIVLFGGNSTFQAALRDVGPQSALHYESRFRLFAEHTIADREFNVKSIAKEAMGANSVVDISLATSNKFSCLLSPSGSPTMITVDLIVLNRRQEEVDELHFDCAEVVREIASPVSKSTTPTSAGRAPVLKEIETTSLYTAVRNSDSDEIAEIKCRQRSAAFLLPSQQDPIALRMWEVSRGRPIDVRYYDVTYTKKT